MITIESVPIDKKTGDEVIGGTINMNGYLQFKATKVGNHTVLANIIEMVKCFYYQVGIWYWYQFGIDAWEVLI
jgi:cation transport ATPase